MITMVDRIFLLNELKKYTVFGVRIVSNIINKDKKYAKLFLYRLKKAGLILELERDRYTVHKDALLAACHITWPCYISSWAAIRYYNLTEQLPHYIEIVTTRPKKKRQIQFMNTTIQFIRIKRDYFFGYEKATYGDFEIFVAEKEKALADALYLKQMSIDTFFEILKEHKKEINIRKFREYLRKMRLNKIDNKIKEGKNDK